VVREHERFQWERLLDSDDCIVGSVGFAIGDVVKVTSGALVGPEGKIKRIDRHQRKVVVGVEMLGEAREIVLMLEAR